MNLDLALQYNPFAGDFGNPGDRQFRDKIVTFRKGGKCCECLGEIEPKTRGRSLTMYWEGDGVETYRICEFCTIAMVEFALTDMPEPMEARWSIREIRREEASIQKSRPNRRRAAIEATKRKKEARNKTKGTV